jgi:hypothetical protein
MKSTLCGVCEKAMLLDAQRAALQAMIDAFQTDSGGQTY